MEVADVARFQVLSLDGGGVMGIFSAAVLAELERDLGKSVVECFDLVVGCSAGGITALALGLGMTPREIVELYSSEMLDVFPHPGGLRRLRQLVRPKYRPEALERALKGVFGGTLLGESRIPLVIPSYDLGENEPHLFKTPHHEDLRRDHVVPMWEVARATSAAPTFLPPHILSTDGSRLVDGGIWNVNPSLTGVAEAHSVFGRPLQEVRVLSLGTTVRAGSRRRELDNGGLLQWARRPHIVETLLHAQSVGAFCHVQHLVGKENAYQLNPPAPESLVQLDAADARDLLAKAGHHSRKFCPEFTKTFASHTPAPYTPHHGPRAGIEVSHG